MFIIFCKLYRENAFVNNRKFFIEQDLSSFYMAGFTKEQALNNLKGLIRRYNENKEDKEYIKNEARICDNLIKPFFELVLGWDTETEFIPQYLQ